MFRPTASLRLLTPGLLLHATLCAQAEWSRVALFAARSGHAMAADASGNGLLVFGGITGSQFLGDTWLWDGSVWQRAGTSGATPTPRTDHVLVQDPVRAVSLLFGGRGANGDLSDTWVFANGQWSRLQPAASPPARSGHAAAFHQASGRVVLFGGRFNQQLRDDTWTWDGTNWLQQPVAQRPSSRSHAALAGAQGAAVVTLFGGVGAAGDLADTWEWSAAGWAARTPAISPAARSRALLLAGTTPGRLVLVGGESASGLHADAWEFDGSNWSTAPAFDLPVGTAGAAGAVAAGAALRVAGGATPTGATSVLLGHAGTAWNELAAESSPPARLDAASAWDPVRGEWLVFGGEGAAGELLQDLWRWNGIRWSRAAGSAAPQPRRGSVLAHDAVSGGMILFGGFGISASTSLPVALDDTWRWDGLAWTQLAPTAAPPARGYAAMCPLPAVASPGLLLAGGLDAALGPLGDAWRWDGLNWSPSTNPPFRARHAHAMTLDTHRGEIVLFGGRSTAAVEADTWTYNGTTWTRRPLTGPQPAARQSHAFAFDPFRGRALLHAGLDATFLALGDSWEWDGAAWSNSASANGPGTRHSGAMGNDPTRRRSVWFGGTGSGLPAAETWTFASPRPPAVTPYGSGCPGSNGTPLTNPVATQLPWLTGTLGVRITNLPAAPGLFVLFFGTFRDTWLGSPLPLDLAGYGLPGCNALARPEEFLFVGHQGTVHDWSTPVISGPSLAGFEMFLQGLSLDAASPNGIGATSNALSVVLGRY